MAINLNLKALCIVIANKTKTSPPATILDNFSHGILTINNRINDNTNSIKAVDKLS